MYPNKGNWDVRVFCLLNETGFSEAWLNQSKEGYGFLSLQR